MKVRKAVLAYEMRAAMRAESICGEFCGEISRIPQVSCGELAESASRL
jgi:hypothetical protein